MPIPTSSMYHNATSQNPRRQQARQLWAEFRLQAMKARKGMQDRKAMALQDMRREWQMKPGCSQKEREQQKEKAMKLYEKQHFLEMREEWQRMLHSNGLQHEDWGEVTAQEMAVIRQVLGPDDIEDEEEEDILIGNGGGSQNYHHPHEFANVNVAAQPLSQSVSNQSQASFSSQSSLSSNHHPYTAPSIASRSQNSSAASYALVDPRNFTDDERDEYSNAMSGRRGPTFTVGPDNEVNGIPIPSYKSWASSGQQPSSGWATHQPSHPRSLSSSPADAFASRHHQPSSSISSTSHFPPQIPSSLSKSISPDDDADRIFTSAMKATVPSPPAGAKTKSKLRSGYIGPQLTPGDSENEADADFASMSKADQIAAYEKFKKEARAQKIREFHEEAAKFDIELAEKINGGSDAFFAASGREDNGYDKAWVARLVEQHERDMLKLRAKKEEERKQLVSDERSRMMAEINKARNGGRTTTTAGTRKGWSVVSKPTSNGGNGVSTMTSSTFTATNRTPVIPAHKPKMPTASPPVKGGGFMDLDKLQDVLGSAPDMGLDTAFQITQLLGFDNGASEASDHGQEHGQDWGTPQLRHAPSTNFSSTTGLRKRSDSVSLLDESRFGTISAKGKQRRGTITVSTANGSNALNGSWKAQDQPPSPEESEALTNQYAKMFLSGGAQTRTSASKAAMRQAEDEDDWVGMAAKSTNKINKPASANTSAGGASAWSKKPSQATGTSSPPSATTNGWGTGVKKTFGFGAASGGGWAQPSAQEAEFPESFEQVEEEEGGQREEELIHPSPFSGPNLQKKASSLLSGVVSRGRNAVAGAVGAALGPMSTNGAPSPIPTAPPAQRARRNSTQMSNLPTPPSASQTLSSSVPAKNIAKKGRQATNKKTEWAPLANQEEEEETQEPEPQQLTTPRARASSTKFTSAWGSQNNSMNVSGTGTPSSRNGAQSGGMWDDIASTTPRPSGLSSVFGGHSTSTAGMNGMRKPSGLHRQVWNADEEQEEQEEQEEEYEQEEQEQEEQEEVNTQEDEWSMPGSLNSRGGFGAGAGAGRLSLNMTSSAKMSAKKNTTQASSAWAAGSSFTSTRKPTTTTASAKKSPLSRKQQVTLEEIPDESERPDRSPSNFLAPDSRIILEPKPSKPSMMFEDIIQFGAEGSSPEDMRHRHQTDKQRNPSASANAEQDVFNQSWYKKAAMELKQGTDQGNKRFGAVSSASQAIPPQSNKDTNTTSRTLGNNSNNHRSSNNGTGPMSGSFKDSPPLTGGQIPKAGSISGDNSNNHKPTLNQGWGSGQSSSSKVGSGIGFGKTKPTTGTSGGFGGGSFGWGFTPSSIFGGDGGAHDASDQMYDGMEGENEDQWEEEKNPGEELEREKELFNSRKRLQDLFGDSAGSNTKPTSKNAAGGAKTATGKSNAWKEQHEREEQERREREIQEQEEYEAREQEEYEAREQEEYEAREQEEREAREQEEREAREQEEREAQEKANKENEAKAKEAAAVKTAAPKTGGKKGKTKKR